MGGNVSQMAKFQVALVKSQYQSIRNDESTITEVDHRARGIFQIASTWAPFLCLRLYTSGRELCASKNIGRYDSYIYTYIYMSHQRLATREQTYWVPFKDIATHSPVTAHCNTVILGPRNCTMATRMHFAKRFLHNLSAHFHVFSSLWKTPIFET